MSYPKHEGGKPRKKATKQKPEPAPESSGIKYLDVNGLEGLAESMQALVRVVGSYAHNATIGENSLALFTGSGEAFRLRVKRWRALPIR